MKDSKLCSRCNTSKQLGEFYFDNRPKRGYKSICKDCENTYKRMKRKLNNDLALQPYSLFLSSFKKRFGDHKNYSEEFKQSYFQLLRVQHKINVRKKNHMLIFNNFVCLKCGQIEPIHHEMDLDNLQETIVLFKKCHNSCSKK